MPDKIILVTGSTDGIGKQTALELARHGEHVLLHGRDQQRVEAALKEIQATSRGGKLDAFTADFSSLSQVRLLSTQLHEKHDHLDVLINNAGVKMKERQLTEDGIETTFQVNHLASFLLTHLVLDLLIAGGATRVVNVSSNTHLGMSLDLKNLQGEKHYEGYNAYAMSKLENVLFTFELAERLKSSLNAPQITANALHPGVINTKLLRASFSSGGDSVRRGAETPVFLAISPEVEGVTGKYFVDRRVSQVSPLAYDQRLRQAIWEISAQLTGINPRDEANR